MKKVIYLLSFISILFTSCNQEVDFPYEGKDRIHFKHFYYENNARIAIDSINYSFGLKSDTIRQDTAKIVVELMGKKTDRDRIYNVSVASDSTTAKEGVHYKVISNQQIFRANRIADTLRVVFLRDNLNSDYTNPSSERLDLLIKESDDFGLGLSKGQRVKIMLNDYLTEPQWWYSYLGYFHPKKWRILISFTDVFANETKCPYDNNNEGREYSTGLRNYLEKIPTYDYIDGVRCRLYKDSVVPVAE